MSEIPSIEKSIANLRELVEIWGPEPDVVRLEVLDQSWVRSATIRTVSQHAVSLAEAVVVLAEQGMYVQCAPLARLIWECSITSMWAAVTPMSGHALVAEADYAKALLQHDLALMNGDPNPPEPKDVVGDWVSWRTAQSKFIKQRAQALDGGVWLYPYYRLLSQSSHGDGSLLSLYVQEGEKHHFGHGWQWRDMSEFVYADVCLALAVVGVAHTLLGWDEVDAAHEHRDALKRFFKATGLRASLDQMRPATT